MTSVECFENKWFYMKYLGKYLSADGECIYANNISYLNQIMNK